MNHSQSIAFVFSGLYVGGAEKFGISLANKFAADGVKTHFILFQKINSPLYSQIDKRIEIIYITRKSKLDFMQRKRFDAAITERKITKVIFFCLTPLFLSRVFSFKRDKAVSYFISLHSTVPESFQSYIYHFVFLHFSRKTDKVLFICQNQRLYHIKRYLFNPHRFEVIYNGVDIEYFKPGNGTEIDKNKQAIQIAANDKVILLVATLRPEKGHTFAIEALNILHKQYKDKNNTHLVFTGGGEKNYISKLKQLVNDYSLQQYVHFEGNQKDVRKYYEMADVFTLTSFSIETFSIAALEAMCYGLPLSLTNIGGASEMIEEGKNGQLTNARDASSIAASWAHLLDAGLDKKAIREIAVKNYSLGLIFQKYKQSIFDL